MIRTELRAAAALTAVFLLLGAGVSDPCLGASAAGTAVETITLRNGPEIILDRYPGSGSALIAVAVRAGSAWETPETRGVTHLLEHLLFDGSERFTREQISGWVDDNGAFLNAFTRKETTVYFLLSRSDLLEESIEILSQMLLHPVFDINEIEKERKVVLEEMSQGRDGSREIISRMADRYLYRGSSLTEPVIGYRSTIESISRNGIIDYYRSRYATRNMRVFVMGDFSREAVIGWIGDYFTAGISFPGGGSPDPKLEPRWSGEVTVRTVESSGGRLDLLVLMPGPEDPLFPATLLISEMLRSPSSTLIKTALAAGLSEPEVNLEIHIGFSALRIGVEGDGADPSAADMLLGALGEAATGEPDEELLERARMSFVSSDIFDRERYHFYIMLNGEAMALAGPRWFDSVSRVGEIKSSHIRKLAAGYLDRPFFNGFSAIPASPKPSAGRRDARSEILEGGMAAAVRRRQGSSVEALCLAFPGRACAGGTGSDGATSLLITLENSNEGKMLEEKLAVVGARIQWGDNPYISMDDYLVNPSWAFVRIEAPSGTMKEAAALLGAFLADRVISPGDIREAVPFVTRELALREGHSSAAMKRIVYGQLFHGHRFGEPLYPVPESWTPPDSVEINDIRRELFERNGAVVSYVTAGEEDEGLGLLRDIFGDLRVGGSDPCTPVPDRYEPGEIAVKSPGSGGRLSFAWRLDGLSTEETAALAVACEALSRRMQLDIRETRGLAYSVGCSMTQIGRHAVVTAGMSTRGENLDEAVAALRENIEAFAAESPTEAEVATAKSRLVSRLSRRELSCAGEALGICLDHILRDGADGLALIASAPFDLVEDLSGQLRMETALLVKMAPGDKSREKKSMPPGMMGR
jgi:predicted Zn-dependent peptidase